MQSLPMLAQQLPAPETGWAPVVLLLLIGISFAAGTLAMTFLIGPSRTGSVKETIYESGMMPTGDTRKRFNIRFYIVAMIFLVFDVEIVFFYPWATIFPQNPTAPLLISMLIFVGVLLLAYFYAWGKGVFKWD